VVVSFVAAADELAISVTNPITVATNPFDRRFFRHLLRD
jgi:hypothetical protein